MTFGVNGGLKLPAITKASGGRVDLSKYTPTRLGYEFTGWYSDIGLKNEITTVTMTENTTVFAGWRLMYVEEAVNPFSDVSSTDWFYASVLTAYENGWFTGVTDTEFDPNGGLTRGMVATVLYRIAGSPDISMENLGYPFADVDENAYYCLPVYWARLNDIVEGYDDQRFGPDDFVTRQQLAAMLWRYARFAGMDVSVGEDTNILSYDDAFDVDEYAIPAIQWAFGAGVMQGSSAKINPQATATRAEAAAMLDRTVAE